MAKKYKDGSFCVKGFTGAEKQWLRETKKQLGFRTMKDMVVAGIKRLPASNPPQEELPLIALPAGRRIIQIASSAAGGTTCLFALCDDGRIWCCTPFHEQGWQILTGALPEV